MKMDKQWCVWTVLLCASVLSGCATQTPSISHVHIGHAITAAHDTPDRAGYLVVAENRASAALAAADEAVRALNVADKKAAIVRVNDETNVRQDYALVKAVTEASGHLRFAAESSDSSANIRAESQQFATDIEGIVYRSNLIRLYSEDASQSQSDDEIKNLAAEVQRLARANVEGDPAAEGSRKSGVQQLRQQLDAAIAREVPPYSTVDRWYLFNLIRLPNGDWIFRRDASGGSNSY